jgi:branched-chain amino acid transport system ATP-binding protein
MKLLELLGLTKDFGRLRAVDHIDLSISEGEIRGLIGPNGSGKTTIFNLISGFARPSLGQIVWKGHNIAGSSPHSVAKRGIARTFQITNIFKEATVLENLIVAFHLKADSLLISKFFGGKRVRDKGEAIIERSLEILDFMGLGGEKDRIAGELPSGSQRVLAIAIALACEPNLMMLDEPLAGMNPVEKESLNERIGMIRKRGVTVLLVEHDMKTIMRICDKVTVINFGKKIAEGTPSAVSNDQKTIEAYLGK